MTQPLVSVCIPAYNNQEYIQSTIRSVLDQSYRNIELILTDDGSTDDTVMLAKQLLQSCDIPHRIEVAEKNMGIQGNWNKALSAARGEYVKLLPGDDVLEPQCIEEQVAGFNRYKAEISLVFCARKIITASGKHLLTARFYQDRLVISSHMVRRCVVAGTNPMGEPGAVLFSMAAAKRAGEFNGESPYVIDLDYWLRLLAHGNAVALGATLASFRIDKNLSVRLGWSRCVQYIGLMNAVAPHWGIPGYLRLWGHCRTVLNELMRRIVHMLFRFLG